MNNYCTNCGEKLNKDIKKCQKCNTLVIDIYRSEKELKKKEEIKKAVRTIAMIFGVIAFLVLIKITKIYILKQKFVIPYVENTMKLNNY